jgi:hypothetical protein
MNGAGNSGPGPGGAVGPGGSPGAKVDGGGVGPAGPSGSVRAPGGAFGGSGTGVPGTSGGGAPGRPAIGMPGVGGRPFGSGCDAMTSGGANAGTDGVDGADNGPKGPWLWSRPAHGSGLPGRGSVSGVGVYEHGDPGATAGPG